MSFVPSEHLNTLTDNGLVASYPGKRDNSLIKFKRVQWLKGGAKYPVDFDVVGTTETAGNATVAGSGIFTTSDSQLNRQFIESVVPECANGS